MKRIVIVGGGFAGVEVAQQLRKQLPKDWELLLYSRENHLCFTPLLTEVVGSALNPLHVVWSIREMVKDVNCLTTPVTKFDFENNSVSHIDPSGNEVSGSYDHLIIAAGLPVRLEIIPGMAEYGWPIKTLGDASALRNHLIAQLERAEVTEDADLKHFEAAGCSDLLGEGGHAGVRHR